MAGGVILFSLHMTMVWDLARGAGIPSTNQCHCCLRKQTSSEGAPYTLKPY